MEPPEYEVEFEHRRPRPMVEAEQLPALQRKILWRAQLTRALFVLAGALALAWGTTQAGIALPNALCLFFGALPVLWVGGWFFGFVLQSRRTALQVVRTSQGTEVRIGNQPATVAERVKLSVAKSGLVLTRGGQAQPLDWKQVHVARTGPEQLLVHLGHAQQVSALQFQEVLAVPASAFASADAFDEFCLTMLRHSWAAQR